LIAAGRLELHGQGVGRSWASGAVLVYGAEESLVERVHLGAGELAAERSRFVDASKRVAEGLRQAGDKLNLSDPLVADAAAVLRAHATMAEDPDFADRVQEKIDTHHINAAWAIERTVAEFARRLEAISDRYIAARAVDLRQVAERVIAELEPGDEKHVAAELSGLSRSIVVARDLAPGAAVELLEQAPAGLITEVGSDTSHLALLCRAFRVPAVVGIGAALEHLVGGDYVLLDATDGVVIRDPDRRDQAIIRTQRKPENRWQPAGPELPSVTRDGHPVRLLANIDVARALEDACNEGAEGVGLYRSEFLLLSGQGEGEAEQAAAYGDLLSRSPGPVTVRTYDIGADKVSPGASAELNPALGVRALRAYRYEPRLFLAQLRALMSVCGAGQKLRIMLPMVDGVTNLRWALLQVETVGAAAGRVRGVDFEVGIMVELPSALFLIDEIANEVDFMSIGSNDLIQYLLAVDRQNPALAGEATPFHPAVMRALKCIVEGAKKAKVPVSCCGQMAAHPVTCMVLLGLGVDELSLPPSALGVIRAVVRKTNSAVLRGLVDQALDMDCSEAIECLFSQHFADLLDDLH
jgi:phosphoenolpyruvate-protein phosphotransferase (PTS system enzyme I)